MTYQLPVGANDTDLSVLLVDESEADRGDCRFRVYAGLALPARRLADVDTLVRSERERIGLGPDQPLKFASAARPANVSAADWKNAKAAVLQGLVAMDVDLLSAWILTDIAAGGEEDWVFEALVRRFNASLSEAGGTGLVIHDHSELLSRGATAQLATGATYVSVFENRYERVMGLASGHVDAFPALSAIDVALGSLRYCAEKPKHDVSAQMFQSLNALLPGSLAPPYNRGLEMIPSQVQIAVYRHHYESLRADLDALATRRSTQ